MANTLPFRDSEPSLPHYLRTGHIWEDWRRDWSAWDMRHGFTLVVRCTRPGFDAAYVRSICQPYRKGSRYA